MNDKTTLQLPQPQISVPMLGVSPYEGDHARLEGIFSHTNWSVLTSRNCSEAIAYLQKRLIPVVVCESSLPDGSWVDILERTQSAANPPSLIVSSELADERLWSEVLNRGGYNVLRKPFETMEVFRDVSLAWQQWHGRQERLNDALHRAAG